MAIWKVEYILVRHKCGKEYWLSTNGGVCDVRKFAIIGSEWWMGESVTMCECGEELTPFRHKQWVEV